MKKFKKWIAMVLAIACVLSLAACGNKGKEENDKPKETVAQNQEDIFEGIESLATENAGAEVGSYVVVPESDLIWEDVDGGVAITSYTGADTAIELPAQVGGKDVVEIRGGAFSSNIVVGVKLPDTLVTIGNQAFYFVTTLVEVQFGANVKTIGSQAFEGCIALTDVELNEGLESIGEMSFASATSLRTLQLPSSVKEIILGAFCMSGLKEIVIPGSVAVVGEQAFSSCADLEKAVIESGVTTIEKKVFESCKALVSVEIPASVETIEFAVFRYCDNVTIYAPAGSAAETYAGENELNFKSK